MPRKPGTTSLENGDSGKGEQRLPGHPVLFYLLGRLLE